MHPVTAQVVVANTRAVAIASDSSVTVTNGGGSRRTFANAEKVFPLPAPHRLAVLHSGNVRFLGVPVDVLLGEWMRDLGDEPLPTLEQYATHFRLWLEASDALLTPELQRRHYEGVLSTYFADLREELIRDVKRASDEADTDEPVDAHDIIESSLRADREYLQSRYAFDDLTHEWAQETVTSMADMIMETIGWAMEDMPRSQLLDHHLTEIATLLAYRGNPFGSFGTTVFTGFGAENMFPVTQFVELEGMLGGRLRAATGEPTAISVDVRCRRDTRGSDGGHAYLPPRL